MDQRSQQLQQEGRGTVMPGFRFHPTDEELVGYYLRRQVVHRPPAVDVITQLDIYKFDPWDLPKMSALNGEKEWYFFCPRDRKYRNSTRPNRVTGAGFWKATGTDRPIYSSDAKKCIGLKKSLVFYTGRAAKSTKTDWMMHEFRMPASSETSTLGRVQSDEIALQQDTWAVCRIFKKSTLAQRHAPPCQQWEITEPQQILNMGASAPSFAMPGSECMSSPDLEHDTSSQERSDTTSEDLDVEGSMQRITTQDMSLPDCLPPRGYSSPVATHHLQQPQQQQLKQEQTTATWPATIGTSMEELLQDTSSAARSNVLQHRAHISSEMYPLEMENIFVQAQTPSSMRGGALEYVRCLINPPQSAGTQFVGSNFDDNMQSLDSTFSWTAEPRMSTPLDIFRKELTQHIPHQRQVLQPFISTHPWD
ncbi:unnamed protein product [Calypogeia fissa]